MNPQLIADLEAAKALIATPDNWVQVYPGTHAGSGKCECITTSLSKATSTWDYSNERFRCAIVALGFEGAREAWAWNDAPERTHAEVMALFDKAIATERSKA